MGFFRPSVRAWAGAPAEQIGFVSANAWDAAGAAGFGFKTFWLDRGNQPSEYGLERSAARIASLRDLAAR